MKPALQSPTDISYVKLYLLLPLILAAFERDKRLIEAHFKTPSPYVVLIDEAIKKVEWEMREVRKKFRELGLKVYEENRTDKGVEAKYLCRGYHHTVSLLPYFVAAEASVLMEKYLGMDIFRYISTSKPNNPDEFRTPIDSISNDFS
ncbi:hypothetical protein D3C73_308650 [compost metagenome]